MSEPYEIIEEHEDNKATGVELEPPDPEDADVASPWDPKKIRVEPNFFSLRQVMDMIDDEELEIAPDFQRRDVWKIWQKSRLIESILNSCEIGMGCSGAGQSLA